VKFGEGPREFERVEMVMTPMIDVCFQIIIFFIANMRIILPEGDFNITMPATAPGRGASPSGAGLGSSAGQGDLKAAAELPAIKISLFADRSGSLAGIQIGERPIGTFKELRNWIRGLCGTDRGPAGGAASPEVEIDFDYNLKYEFVMDAVNAISGYPAEDRQSVVRMIEKIKFGTLRRPK
jgi:biopolymer transport protein ExbD